MPALRKKTINNTDIEVYEMVQDHFLSILENSGYGPNDRDTDNFSILNQSKGIVVEFKEEIQRKFGLVRRLYPQEGTALSELERKKFELYLQRQEQEVKILKQEVKSRDIENSRKDEILDSIIQKAFSLEQSMSASYFLLKGKDIMDKRLLLKMNNNNPNEKKPNVLNLNGDK